MFGNFEYDIKALKNIKSITKSNKIYLEKLEKKVDIVFTLIALSFSFINGFLNEFSILSIIGSLLVFLLSCFILICVKEAYCYIIKPTDIKKYKKYKKSIPYLISSNYLNKKDIEIYKTLINNMSNTAKKIVESENINGYHDSTLKMKLIQQLIFDYKTTEILENLSEITDFINKNIENNSDRRSLLKTLFYKITEEMNFKLFNEYKEKLLINIESSFEPNEVETYYKKILELKEKFDNDILNNNIKKLKNKILEVPEKEIKNEQKIIRSI